MNRSNQSMWCEWGSKGDTLRKFLSFFTQWKNAKKFCEAPKKQLCPTISGFAVIKLTFKEKRYVFFARRKKKKKERVSTLREEDRVVVEKVRDVRKERT